jgi:hypothetical protein
MKKIILPLLFLFFIFVVNAQIVDVSNFDGLSNTVVDVNSPKLAYTNRNNTWSGYNYFTNVSIENLTVINESWVEGNVTADYFIGDGSLLTGIDESDTLQSVTDRGATTDNDITIDKGGLVNSALHLVGSVSSTIRSTATDTLQLRHNGINAISIDGQGDVTFYDEVEANTFIGDIETYNITAPISVPAGPGTGGTITTDGEYYIHTFTSDGTFVAPAGITEIEYLILGGGGGGRQGAGGDAKKAGAGGAGVLTTGTIEVSTGSYPVTIGLGGSKGTFNGDNGDAGTASSALGITSAGGTGGNFDNGGNSNYPGGSNTANAQNGGGGGTAEAGHDGYATMNGGDGGDGTSNDITGTPIYYGGGGGGQGDTSGGSGGLGGGGNGCTGSSGATNGVDGLGGGGGSCRQGTAGDGGNGIVILRYIPDPANIQANLISVTDGESEGEAGIFSIAQPLSTVNIEGNVNIDSGTIEGTLTDNGNDVLWDGYTGYATFNRRVEITQPLGWSSHPALLLTTDKTESGGYERPHLTFNKAPSNTANNIHWGVSNGAGGCYPGYLKFDRLDGDGDEICGYDFALDTGGAITTSQDIKLREDKKIASHEHGALSYWVIWDGYDGTLMLENGIDVNMYKYDSGGWRNRDVYYLRAVGSTEADMEWDSDVDIEYNEAQLFFGDNEEVELSYDGTQLVLDTTGAGNETFYITNDVSATGFITRTYETNISDKEAYELVSNALLNENNADGSYNHQAWGECYEVLYEEDKTKPIYDTISIETKEIDYIEQLAYYIEVTEKITENPEYENPKVYYNTYSLNPNDVDINKLQNTSTHTYEIINDTITHYKDATITEQVITGYEKKEVGGVNIDCKQVMLTKYNNYISSFLNPTETAEGLMIDTDIISAESIYTESKVPIPDYNYVEKFDIDNISKKQQHYAVETFAGQERLNMEDRIVYLEGAIAQLSTELCSVSNNKYSWCCKTGKEIFDETIQTCRDICKDNEYYDYDRNRCRKIK